MGYRLPPNEWPACIKGHREVKGVYVGGCVIGHDKRFYRTDGNKRIALAHAHTKGKHRGWICVPYKTRLRAKFLMLHELAHLKERKHHHEKKWRKAVKKLGGTLKPYKLPGSTLRAKDHRTFLEKLFDFILDVKISTMSKVRQEVQVSEKKTL